MPWGAAIAAVGAIGSSAISSSGGGRATAEAQDTVADIAGLGLTQILQDNTIRQDDNQFSDLSTLFGQLAQQQVAASQNGPTIDVNAATGGVAGLQQNQQDINGAFSSLAGAINGQSAFDVDAFANEQFDRLNSLAARGEQTAASQTANSLFSRGRLGGADTASGNVFEALDRSQRDAATSRALTATQLAGAERDRLFNEQQQGVSNQFDFLSNLIGNNQNQVGNFGNLFQLNSNQQQQFLQNALGFGQGAGNVLNPNFQALALAQNVRSSDQASRAGVSSTNAQLQTQANTQLANNIGQAFSGVGTAVAQGFADRRANGDN